MDFGTMRVDRPPEHFKRHQGGGPGYGQGRHAEAHADRDQPLHGHAEETGRGVGAKAVVWPRSGV